MYRDFLLKAGRHKSKQGGPWHPVAEKEGLPKISHKVINPTWETSLHYATGEGTKEKRKPLSDLNTTQVPIHQCLASA